MLAFPLLLPPNTTHLNALCFARVPGNSAGDLRRTHSKSDLEADRGEGAVVCSALACWMFAATVKISLTPRPRGALDSRYVAWIERANAEACSCKRQSQEPVQYHRDMPHRTTLVSVKSLGMSQQ
jgi:hypothetical protein